MHFFIKYLLLLLIPCFTILTPLSSECQVIHFFNHKVSFPNFNQGLLRGGRSKEAYILHLGAQNKNTAQFERKQHQLEELRRLYNEAVSIIKVNAAALEDSEILHIPRIVHQIWLGSPVPKQYQEWMKTWMNWKGWEYRLWTDLEVGQLKLINQDIYDKVKNYGQKADILRIELLYLMGGLYIDTDFECLNADFFELLHRNVDFYAGVEPLEHSCLRINNAIVGCVPGHPLIEKMIQELPAHFEATKNKWALISTGPVFMTKVVYDYLKEKHSEINVFLPCSLVYH